MDFPRALELYGCNLLNTNLNAMFLQGVAHVRRWRSNEDQRNAFKKCIPEFCNASKPFFSFQCDSDSDGDKVRKSIRNVSFPFSKDIAHFLPRVRVITYSCGSSAPFFGLIEEIIAGN